MKIIIDSHALSLLLTRQNPRLKGRLAALKALRNGGGHHLQSSAIYFGLSTVIGIAMAGDRTHAWFIPDDTLMILCTYYSPALLTISSIQIILTFIFRAVQKINESNHITDFISHSYCLQIHGLLIISFHLVQIIGPLEVHQCMDTQR